MSDMNTKNELSQISNYPTGTTNQQGEEDTFNFRDLWALFLPKWRWFALSIVVVLAGTCYYLLTAQKVYQRTASVLIQDRSNKTRSGIKNISEIRDLGMFNSSTSVDDEQYVIQSPSLMMEVTKKLKLNDFYIDETRMRPVDLYGISPVYVTLRSPEEKKSYHETKKKKAPSFLIKILDGGKVKLSDFTCEEDFDDVTVSFGQTIKTPLGLVTVTATKEMSDEWVGSEIRFRRANAKLVAMSYTKNIGVELQDKNANILALSLDDTSAKRAEDVLNSLIEEYNEAWVKDNNRVAISTSQFITERLALLENELGNVDSDISNYKSSTLVPDVEMAAESYMKQSEENRNQLFELTNQLAMANFMKEELDKEDLSQVLPSNINTGAGSQTLQTQITSYNNMVLERERLMANSSENNPLVQDLTKSLKATRYGVVRTVDNLITQYKSELKALQGKDVANTSKIASAPGQAKYLLSVERQQKVKEALYLYLLQKREENEISMTFTAYNTRVIAEPDGSPLPVAPASKKILLIAFVIAIALPAGVIYLLETTNTRVRGRRDIASLTVPFVGELPIYKPKDSTLDTSNTVVVQENNIDYINEAMRVLRTNIEFMKGDIKGAPVFMSTSMNAGSGKTFISINLATSLAIKGKKVVVVDLDLRKMAISEYINQPKRGISNYLGGMVDDWHELVVKGKLHPNLDILPGGTIPPNPTELLTSTKLDEIIAELKQHYDYVFIDCPPVEIVADTDIVKRVADITMFVIRAGLLERDMLPRIESYYKENRLPSMSIILNGTKFLSHGRYGYNYGYGGYGYHGYHYGYHQAKKKK